MLPSSYIPTTVSNGAARNSDVLTICLDKKHIETNEDGEETEINEFDDNHFTILNNSRFIYPAGQANPDTKNRGPYKNTYFITESDNISTSN